MSVLAKADPAALADLAAAVAAPPCRTMREPEVGMVMVRGRAGGVGGPFNLGEMTVTRAAVRVGDTVGLGYVAGRSREGARLAALVDAMMQDPGTRAEARDRILAPLEAAALARREAGRAKTAATRVEFFTMVRTREPQ